MRRFTITVAALAMSSLPLYPQAVAACGTRMEVRSLKMEAEAESVVVPPGQSAVFEIAVTRGGDDYNGPRQAAEGVGVSILLSPRYRPVWGLGTTDENGEATISIRIPRRAREGWVNGIGRASFSRYEDEACWSVREVDDWSKRRVILISSKR